MQPFRKSRPIDQELEARLRAERPRPSAELTRSVAGHRPRGHVWGGLGLRLGLAAALTVMLAVGGFAAGGGDPIGAFEQARDVATSGNSGRGANSQPPANDQYNNRVTICHRGNSPNNPGETLTLPRQAAEAHLRQHRYDTAGPCPPPPERTICHRGNSPNNPGQTLTLPVQAAEAHLRQHRYDTRGAC